MDLLSTEQLPTNKQTNKQTNFVSKDHSFVFSVIMYIGQGYPQSMRL